MEQDNLPKLMEDWGYYLLPPTHPASPGFGGLVVAIRARPTGKHFDPEVITLRLRDDQGLATRAALSHRYPSPGSGHACPGRVILEDRFEKRVEFFTFGGSLEAIAQGDDWLFPLKSPAPILELESRRNVASDLLATETEALLAEIDARTGKDDEGFSRKLAAADPLQLYVAALDCILERCKRSEALAQVYQEPIAGLRREKDWLEAEGLWPDHPPLLEEMLWPDPSGH